MLPDEQSHGLSVFNEMYCRHKIEDSDDFWVQDPRHSENVFAKKNYYLYRSTPPIVPCVENIAHSNSQ